MIAYEFRFTFQNGSGTQTEVIAVTGGPGESNELRAARVAGRRLVEKVGEAIENVTVEMRKRARR